jgi:hypothetical protein
MHCLLSSPKRLVRILTSIVKPAACFLFFGITDNRQISKNDVLVVIDGIVERGS